MACKNTYFMVFVILLLLYMVFAKTDVRKINILDDRDDNLLYLPKNARNNAGTGKSCMSNPELINKFTYGDVEIVYNPNQYEYGYNGIKFENNKVFIPEANALTNENLYYHMMAPIQVDEKNIKYFSANNSMEVEIENYFE